MDDVSSVLAGICEEPWCDKGERIVVEYECDDSVNIASNVKKVQVKGKFLILFDPDGEEIKIKVFQDGKLIAKLQAKKVVIPIDRVCAILFDGEVDDHHDSHDGGDGGHGRRGGRGDREQGE